MIFLFKNHLTMTWARVGADDIVLQAFFFFFVWSRDITNIYLITGTHHSGWKINMNVIIHKNTANIRTESLTDSGIFRVQLVGNDQMYVVEWQKIHSSGFTSVDHIHWLDYICAIIPLPMEFDISFSFTLYFCALLTSVHTQTGCMCTCSCTGGKWVNVGRTR